MVTEALIETFPVARYDASLAQVLEEIAAALALPDDWDGEGALPISSEATQLAAWLVQMVAHSARHHGLTWRPPVVGPNPDGGINIEWEGTTRQLFVLIRPDQQPLVECVVEETGSMPQRQMVSAWEAIDLALSTLPSH